MEGPLGLNGRFKISPGTTASGSRFLIAVEIILSIFLFAIAYLYDILWLTYLTLIACAIFYLSLVILKHRKHMTPYDQMSQDFSTYVPDSEDDAWVESLGTAAKPVANERVTRTGIHVAGQRHVPVPPPPVGSGAPRFALYWAKVLRHELNYPTSRNKENLMVANIKLKQLFASQCKDLRVSDRLRYTPLIVNLAFIPSSDEFSAALVSTSNDAFVRRENLENVESVHAWYRQGWLGWLIGKPTHTSGF